MVGFAECVLDEGHYFASIPHNAEEERIIMKQEVLAGWEDRAIRAESQIIEELEPELRRLRYEKEITRGYYE